MEKSAQSYWMEDTTGGLVLLTEGGDRWKIRKVMMSGPSAGNMFWVYLNGTRYSRSGKFWDLVSFHYLDSAKEFVEQEIQKIKV